MTDAPPGSDWSANARNRSVTDQLLEQAREVLEGMQRWQEAIRVACGHYNFQTFEQACEWFETVPRVDPGNRELREAWVRAQRKIATRKPAPGPIPEDRAMEIAMAALEVASRPVESELDGRIRIFHARNYNDTEIAEAVGVSKETVQRHRKTLSLAANGDGGQHTKAMKEQAA